jgi:hypothetical protein
MLVLRGTEKLNTTFAELLARTLDEPKSVASPLRCW